MKRDKPHLKLLIFDGDDTLWDTMSLYYDAKLEFGRVLQKAGFPSAESLPLLEAIDLDNVRYYGFSLARFPLSMTQAHEQLCYRVGRIADPRLREKLALIGRRVFDQPARVAPGVHRLLGRLNAKYALVLCTKGDETLQAKRIAQAEMQQYFQRIYIVPTKTVNDFSRILSDFQARPASGCSIGNSVRSDINPALQVGMAAIWIHRPTWTFEDEAPRALGNVVTIPTIKELPEALAALEEEAHEPS